MKIPKQHATTLCTSFVQMCTQPSISSHQRISGKGYPIATILEKFHGFPLPGFRSINENTLCTIITKVRRG